MQTNPGKKVFHRRSIRLKEYDYSEEASYFVTVVTHLRKPILGQVVNEKIILSPEGKILADLLNDLQNRFPQISVDCCVIMPNHFHAILTISQNEIDEDVNVRAIHELPLPQAEHINLDLIQNRSTRRRMLIPLAIGFIKMNTAKKIIKAKGTPGEPVWHRNYYEHIINSDEEFDAISTYIKFNPANWESKDEYHHG